MYVVGRYGMGVAALALCLACAGNPQSSEVTPRSSSRDVLTRAQIDETAAGTVYDAVQQLRPQWFTVRSTSIREGAVAGASGASRSTRPPSRDTGGTPPTPVATFGLLSYVDGVKVGDVSYLRSVRIEDVDYVRYWNGRDAARRFGPAAGGGVIEVVRAGRR